MSEKDIYKVNSTSTIIRDLNKDPKYLFRTFCDSEREPICREFFNFSNTAMNKHLSFLYSGTEDEPELFGFRFYKMGYEVKTTEDEEPNFFTLVLPEAARVSINQMKTEPNIIKLINVNNCKIAEQNLTNSDCHDILLGLFQSDLEIQGSTDIHGINFKTLAFCKLIDNNLGEHIRLDYNNLFEEVNSFHGISFDDKDPKESNNQNYTKINSPKQNKDDKRFVLKPINIHNHAVVVLFDNLTNKYYLFDSSLHHFNEKEKIFDKDICKNMKLTCNTDEKNFQSSGDCTYYSMCFIKIISQKSENEIEEIINNIEKQQQLQLDIIAEMSNIFDQEENKTFIKADFIDETKYIKIEIDGNTYGLNRKAYLSNFLELGGVEKLIGEHISKEKDKEIFESMVQYQNILLYGKIKFDKEINDGQIENEYSIELPIEYQMKINISYREKDLDQFEKFIKLKEEIKRLEKIYNYVKKGNKGDIDDKEKEFLKSNNVNIDLTFSTYKGKFVAFSDDKVIEISAIEEDIKILIDNFRESLNKVLLEKEYNNLQGLSRIAVKTTIKGANTTEQIGSF